MASKYRILTERGYYYTVANGRYGRIDGQKLWADILCHKHAQEQVDSLNGLTQLSGEHWLARLEEFPGHAPCRKCTQLDKDRRT